MEFDIKVTRVVNENRGDVYLKFELDGEYLCTENYSREYFRLGMQRVAEEIEKRMMGTEGVF